MGYQNKKVIYKEINKQIDRQNILNIFIIINKVIVKVKNSLQNLLVSFLFLVETNSIKSSFSFSFFIQISYFIKLYGLV